MKMHPAESCGALFYSVHNLGENLKVLEFVGPSRVARHIVCLQVDQGVPAKAPFPRLIAEKASAAKELCPELLPCFRRMRRAARAPSRAPLHLNTPIL